MAVGYSELPELIPVTGIRLSSVAAGIRYRDRNDVVLIELAKGGSCAAVFTRNAFCAAPVVVAREHLATGAPHFLLVNSGNANAGTGEPGIEAARSTCESLADKAGCQAQDVLPFSTGVIGVRLPVERIEAVLDRAIAGLSEAGWRDAAHAIMTTDTVGKGVSLSIDIGGKPVTLTGIAKGAGMIRPDMATMLAYVATDAPVEVGTLQSCLNTAVEQSFNRITVDGDTSTNDACVLLASGAVDLPPITQRDPAFGVFSSAITKVCQRLAELIVRDAEGATKFVTVCVEQGRDARECLDVAYTVAHSPLVKTALFASDPNWGRILAAVGRAGLDGLDVTALHIFLGPVCIVRDGAVAAEYREEDGQVIMDQNEILIRIQLGRGAATERVWTCDLSNEYVRINAEYRS
jgi:glutamate N-acetyltransferase/amino-acid N-acetyltransferase